MRKKDRLAPNIGASLMAVMFVANFFGDLGRQFYGLALFMGAVGWSNVAFLIKKYGE